VAGRTRRPAYTASVFNGEQQQESDQQREDAERFRHREAEDQAAELAVSSRRIAQGASEVVAEDVAETNARAAHAKAGNTGTDELCCFRFHGRTPSMEL
jgi:hypothetical protein